MRCLVDTHALIWWWNEDARLSAAAREAMSARRNTIFVSAATAWEIATKVRAGRLPSMEERMSFYDNDVIEDGFQHLDIRAEHGVRGGLLEGDHRDPFDRLIAAQALIEDMTVVTRDPEIGRFGCKVLW
jgi:PIN domain nuclease of toxin-antitoxin system